jgi:hypothetical protein
MPLGLGAYVDSPGAPRRAVYPDFTIGSDNRTLTANSSWDITHQSAVPLVPAAGLNIWYLMDRPIVSWSIYLADPPAAVRFGSLVIYAAATAADPDLAINIWRVYALNAGQNIMEGLFVPGHSAIFRIVNGNVFGNALYSWLIKAQGL